MSHSFIAVANIVNGVDLDTFPAWLRITHFINFIMMGFLIRSGWEVLASHPRLYWNNHCTPGSEWIKFTKDKVSTVPGEFTARDDQRSLHPLISLPGRGEIGLGRAWHALVTSIWLLNGFIYVALLLEPASGAESSLRRGRFSPRPGKAPRSTWACRSLRSSTSSPMTLCRSSCTSQSSSSSHL